ncbi:hypothetical protein ALC57_05843 [Trachymyrmex cornetzi]|uniref:Uncharacterized protein n=1 Tax=Trachymyrmex cornetzi TaxID=471704 RepID=A0A151J9M9_9HYME|nr:hypothetical protein ALC57_05843 [Trachymyrmex cornetzi]
MQTPAGRRVSPDSRKREEPRLSVSRRLRPLCLRAPHPQCNPPLANLPAPARGGEGDPWPRLGLPVGPSSEDLQGEGDLWPRMGLPVPTRYYASGFLYEEEGKPLLAGW